MVLLNLYFSSEEETELFSSNLLSYHYNFSAEDEHNPFCPCNTDSIAKLIQFEIEPDYSKQKFLSELKILIAEINKINGEDEPKLYYESILYVGLEK